MQVKNTVSEMRDIPKTRNISSFGFCFFQILEDMHIHNELS